MPVLQEVDQREGEWAGVFSCCVEGGVFEGGADGEAGLTDGCCGVGEAVCQLHELAGWEGGVGGGGGERSGRGRYGGERSGKGRYRGDMGRATAETCLDRLMRGGNCCMTVWELPAYSMASEQLTKRALPGGIESIIRRQILKPFQLPRNMATFESATVCLD